MIKVKAELTGNSNIEHVNVTGWLVDWLISL